MTLIGKLLKEFEEVLGLERCKAILYNESIDDGKEVILSKKEYAIVMSTLETWLKFSINYKYKTYIRKEIHIENIETYAYTYKKTGNDYKIIDKEVI